MIKERGMMLQKTAAHESCHDAGNQSSEHLRAKRNYSDRKRLLRMSHFNYVEQDMA
jgi:hypothetical protein